MRHIINILIRKLRYGKGAHSGRHEGGSHYSRAPLNDALKRKHGSYIQIYWYRHAPQLSHLHKIFIGVPLGSVHVRSNQKVVIRHKITAKVAYIGL